MSAIGLDLEGMSLGEAATNETIVRCHTSLVKRIAIHLAHCIGSDVEIDDLIQAGMVGLMEAVPRYQCSGGASFATFAAYRIRGAMIDYLRTSDWGPRSLRRRARDIKNAQRRIESQSGMAATPFAVADALGISISEYSDALRDLHLSKQISWDQRSPTGFQQGCSEPADNRATPIEELENAEVIREIRAAIRRLPKREQRIFTLYYEKGRLMRDIGALMSLSESRVCQIHKRIIQQLRAALRQNPLPLQRYVGPLIEQTGK